MASFVHPTFGLLGLITIPARAPFTESLGFLTDVNPAYDGGEGRIRLRSKPRQRLGMEFTAQPADSKAIFNTVYGGMARRWGVPVWPLGRACGTVSETQTAINVDTLFSDYRVGGPVLILGVCGEWFRGYIDSMTDSEITLVDPAPMQVRGAYAVPVRVRRIVSSVQRDTSGYGADWDITFEVDDNLEWEPAAPDQYFGDDIYLTPGLLDGDTLGERVFTQLETFDYSLGPVTAFTPWLNNRTSRPYRVITETDAEAWALRGWLHRRAGRYRQFWQPSFENDVRLAQTGALASTVTVYADDRNPWTSNRLNLAFGLRDGTWLPRRVTSDNIVDASTRQLGLNTALGVNASEVIAISYMGLKRLEGDTVELNWLGNGRCGMSASVVELSP